MKRSILLVMLMMLFTVMPSLLATRPKVPVYGKIRRPHPRPHKPRISDVWLPQTIVA